MINFPTSPVLNQTFIAGGVTWIWDGAKWTQFGATSPGLVQGINPSRIINGDMRIDQRNNGASGTAGGYTVDHWAIGGTLVKLERERGTKPQRRLAARFYLRLGLVII